MKAKFSEPPSEAALLLQIFWPLVAGRVPAKAG